jgi:hypothetical protein
MYAEAGSLRRRCGSGQLLRPGRASSGVCYGRRAVSARRQYLVFFALIVSVIAAVVALDRPPRTARLLDSVPRGAWLVATLDVAALRASPYARILLGSGENSVLPGLGSLAARCGFDPVGRLQELVVTAPEAGERGDFGVAFTGDFTRDELSRCADRVIRGRGGSPVTSVRGRFTLVEDTSDAMHARLAYRQGGPFLVGRGAWLDAMIDATEAKAVGLRSDHGDLRAALAARSNGPQALVVTALLPASVRHELTAELGPVVVGGEGAAADVLAVSAAGIAVSLGGPGGEVGMSITELRAELRCERSSACEAVKALIEQKRAALSRDLTVRLAGLSPLVDSLTVEARASALTASARAPSPELAQAVERVLDLHPPGAAPPLPATGAGVAGERGP